MAALGGRDDLLLIAGKGHETGQTIKGVTHPFDDAEVARELAEAVTERALDLRRGGARAGAGGDLRAVRGERRHLRQPRRRQGDLFVALTGESTDGHGFVAEALKRGAAAAVVSRDVEGAGGTLIRVPDTLKALVDLGRAGRRRSQARIASVTGSVGKTSTKDALRAMLAAQAPTSASAASFNNHVGVPISLARLPREARYGVFEIGMNHPGEIEPLARQVEAHVGVITNVGPVHIGHMGSEEAIADEKACLFAGMAAGAVAVLNRDNRHYDRLVAPCPPLRRVARRRLRPQRRRRGAASFLQPAGFGQRCCSLDPRTADRVSPRRGRRALGAEQHGGAGRRGGAGCKRRRGGGDAQGHRRVAGPRRAADAEVRRRPGGAARRELQRQSGLDAGDAGLAGAHRAGPGRPPSAGDGRHARAGRGGGCLPCRACRRGRGERRVAGLPVRPAHAGAVAQALAPAQRGVHRPDSAALAGEVAAALRAGRRDRGEGLVGLKNESMSSMPGGGKRRRAGR